ncbi:hypothetical protein [Achromobacter xylosoxidans]|nr:hypothetical protein [Achromobacter xylosoxidans]
MTTPQRPLVVITGASSGIGLATARLFSSHGPRCCCWRGGWNRCRR